MARRRAKRGRASGWAIAAAIAAAALVAWWFRADRVEAPGPPPHQPGAATLSEGHGHGHGHGEITPDEKADLERIIRERGAAAPGS